MTQVASSPHRYRWLNWIGLIAAIALVLVGITGQFVLPVVRLHLAVERLKALGFNEVEHQENVFAEWQVDLARRAYGQVNVQAPTVLDFKEIPITDADLAIVREFPTLINLDLTGQPISAEGFRNVERLPIKWLTISNTQIGAGDCHRSTTSFSNRQASIKVVAATLGSLAELESLTAVNTPLADSDLSELSKLNHLEVLNLDDTCLTPQVMSHLGSISALKFLYLNRTRVTDLGLSELKRNTKLQELALNGTQVTGKGFRDFAKHPLQSLQLDDANVDDVGLGDIVRLEKLAVLRLSRCRVTDAGCAHLLKLKGLQDLFLHGCQITDATLSTICKIERLREIDLAETQVTAQGVGRLQILTGLAILEISGELLKDVEFIEVLTRFPNLSVVRFKRNPELRLDIAEIRARLGTKIFLEVLR